MPIHPPWGGLRAALSEIGTMKMKDGVGDLRPVAAAIQLLGDATRLRLLLLLAGGEFNVTELCKRLGLPQPTVSHHLGLLRTAGMVEPRRQGKCI